MPDEQEEQAQGRPQAEAVPGAIAHDARSSPGDDHSSSPVIAGRVKRPTRRHRTGRPDRASLFGLAPCGV